MSWTPLSRSELNELIAADLADSSDEDRGYFNAVAVEPTKWRQSPYGDEGGGFWVVAVDGDRVLWYNDIEEGFNVSRFTRRGTKAERKTGSAGALVRRIAQPLAHGS